MTLQIGDRLAFTPYNRPSPLLDLQKPVCKCSALLKPPARKRFYFYALAFVPNSKPVKARKQYCVLNKVIEMF